MNDHAIKKRGFYAELCYILGLILPAISNAMMTKADFGLSMIVSPAYILHLKLSQFHRFFTFGVCCYLFEAALLLLMCLVLRRFKLSYLFSFVTAVLYGYTLDGAMFLLGWIDTSAMWTRVLFFGGGLLIGTLGIAFMLHTYISSEVYELVVKEFSRKFGFDMGRCKIVYDLSSLALSILLSLLLFSTLVGIGWGTLISAVLNGVLIGFFSKQITCRLKIKDALPWRKFFEA